MRGADGMLPAAGLRPGADMLASWAEGLGQSRAEVQGRGCLRFAFYGRVSTEEWQDPVTSRARQLQQAVMLTAGRGGDSGRVLRHGGEPHPAMDAAPAAAALVAALADPDRGWDAVVIGEYERAFYGSQYASMAPLFEHYGIQLWMPEVGGQVDWHAEDHEQTMLALGLSSKREITRTRIRVRTAMAAQTREQGRYLGGRPPYGHLSAPEIAGELSVSTSTVKTHLRNLYGKLGAHSRAGAVESARALGLLAPSARSLSPAPA